MSITRERYHIKFIGKKSVCKKWEYIGGLKLGYNRKKMCKNTLYYFCVNILKRHLKRNGESIY